MTWFPFTNARPVNGYTGKPPSLYCVFCLASDIIVLQLTSNCSCFDSHTPHLIISGVCRIVPLWFIQEFSLKAGSSHFSGCGRVSCIIKFLLPSCSCLPPFSHFLPSHFPHYVADFRFHHVRAFSRWKSFGLMWHIVLRFAKAQVVSTDDRKALYLNHGKNPQMAFIYYHMCMCEVCNDDTDFFRL